MTTTAPPAGDLARRFNDATKLEYINLASKPPLYKTYPGLRAINLPDAAAGGGPAMSTLAAIRGASNDDSSGNSGGSAVPLTAATLSTLLYHTGAVIRRRQLRDGAVHYRAAASAGALYPTEMYVVCGDLDGRRAGVYHYNPLDATLSRLRNGDLRRWLAAAVGDRRAYPAALVFTTVFWRSAWKYRERGYRYCFWDNGTILANMLAAANALGQPAALATGFADAEVDALLGLDSDREASFCAVSVGAGNAAPPAAAVDAAPAGVLGDERRTVYPETRALHVNSCLNGAGEVLAWRPGAAPPSPDFPDAAGWPESAPLGEVIARRGSTRRFAREPLPAGRLEALLAASAAPIPADYGGGLIDIYLIVNAADGIDPGTYYYNPGIGGGLELLQGGEFREEAGHLCFEQALGADAGAVAFFMADLDAALSRLGNRGYRAAQLEAGIIGGRMYLCAHGLGLGATGMTFFDDAVTAFFSPHAAGKSLMFLAGLGRTATPNQVAPFRSRIGMLKDSLARGAGGGGQPVPQWLYS